MKKILFVVISLFTCSSAYAQHAEGTMQMQSEPVSLAVSMTVVDGCTTIMQVDSRDMRLDTITLDELNRAINGGYSKKVGSSDFTLRCGNASRTGIYISASKPSINGHRKDKPEDDGRFSINALQDGKGHYMEATLEARGSDNLAITKDHKLMGDMKNGEGKIHVDYYLVEGKGNLIDSSKVGKATDMKGSITYTVMYDLADDGK